MKKQSWRVIERMHKHFLEVVEAALNEDETEDEDDDGDENDEDEDDEEDEADAETAVALAYPLLMRGLGYALEVLGKPERRMFRRLKFQLTQLVPPLSRDYTDIFNEVRNLSKKVTYFEEDVEVLESLEGIADGVNEFIDDLRKLAITAGDAP
jgi:hypothetical protein